MTDDGREHGRTRTRRVLALLLAAGLVLYWLLAVALQWGDRTLVGLTFGAVILLLVMLIDWFIVRFGPGIWRVLRSVSSSIARALREDPEVRRIEELHPRAMGWLRRRLTLKAPTGLYLTLTVLGSTYFLWGFMGIAANVGLAKTITRYDPQIYALFRAFRTPLLTRIFYTATLFGDPSAFVPLVAVGAVLLWMWAKRREAALFVGTIASGYGLGSLVRLFFDRARPPANQALLQVPSSASFPSEHALITALFAFTLTFILVREVPHIRRRASIAIIAIVAVVLVGLSRIYLGVHWPSDVLASWLLALGWVTLMCGAFAILSRYGPPVPAFKPWFGPKTRWVITSLVTKLAALLVAVAAIYDPLVGKIVAPPPTVQWQVHTTQAGLPAPSQTDVAALPLFSEKLDGTRQEPAGIIFIGSQDQLVAAFKKAGWQAAQRPSLANLVNTGIAALQNKPSPNAPVTPTFLDGNVQDLAFEKPAGRASARQRHHTRFWKTRFTFHGSPVWVATASFDSRIEIGSTLPLPTHHIEPDIDAERDYIVADLARVGVEHVSDVRVSQPLSGTNAQGDTFFTKGVAAVLVAPR